jgi:Protein of unknown function (DUF1826)
MQPDGLAKRPHDWPTIAGIMQKTFRGGPLGLIPRTLYPAIAGALDAVPAANLPKLRLSGPLAAIESGLRQGLAEAGFGPDWLANWLVEDIGAWGRLFQEVTGADRLRIRLESVEDDACRRFHTDNMRYRLVCTYRGPGTQWIEPRMAADLPVGAPMPEAAIRQLERGTVAIMRGGKQATTEAPGLLHRSPPIAGAGVTRLFLAIDDLGDHELRRS